MPELHEEVKKALGGLEADLGKKFDEYESRMKANGDATNEVKSDLKKMSEDHQSLLEQLKNIETDVTEMFQKGTKGDQKEAPKSLGQQFVESEAFKSFQSGQSTKAKMEFKNTIIGEGGSPQEPTNDIVPLQTMAGIVGGAFRQLRLMDLLNVGQATGNTIHYTRELTFTNNAAETREGAQKPETELTFEGVDVPVRTIPHFLKVSKQVLDDAPALQSYIDRRLRYGVELRMEKQIINGDGTSPNLAGMLASGNFTSLTAASGDNNYDFANKAKYKVVESDYQADYYLINPQDWGKIERLKDNDGRYIGDGAVGYLQNGLIPTLWGLPVIASNSVPAGKLLAVANDASMFWQRQATTVEIFDQNEDDVEKNLLTIRAEARGAFSVFRPAAIVAGDLPDPAA